MAGNLLEVRNLKKYYSVKSGFLNKDRRSVKAVDGINLSVKQGEILGIVGESGCGKSTFGRSILRLIEPTSGEVIFEGTNICGLKKEEMRLKRREMQIVFQDPGASLNPRLTVGEIIGEPLEVFHICEGKEKEERIYKLMDLVGINRAYINRFPHEFSGGQKQRISMARAIITRPKLVICDEPVSALDVSIQAQVLNLLRELQNEYQLSYLFISHDMSVVKYISDRIAVMYLGTIVEEADAEELFANPIHPYTRALVSAVPEADPDVKKERIVLHGEIPSPVNFPSGCPFHTRCEYATERCNEERPKRTKISNNHYAVCHYCDRLQKEGEGV